MVLPALLAGFCVSTRAHAEDIILDEQFVDNRNSWGLQNTRLGWVAIQGGKLLIAGRDPQPNFVVIHFVPPLKGLSEYTVETALAKISGAPEKTFGLVWGGADLANHYLFAITTQGQFWIGRRQAGVFVESTPLMDGAFNRGEKAKNVLKVVCRKQRVYYFINDVLYGGGPLSVPASDGVGFTVAGTDYIAIDSLRISRSISERDEGLCAELDAGNSVMVAPPQYRLGVQIKDMDADLMRLCGIQKPYGVYVEKVEPNSPAQECGVSAKDVILSVNGVRAYTSAGTTRMISLNSQVELELWRGGRTLTVKATLKPYTQAPVAGDVLLTYPVVISKVEVAPEKVKPQGTFDLKITYIARSATGEPTVPINLTYTISKDNKKVFEKSASMSAPHNQETTSIKQGITVGEERGLYEVRVTLRSAGKSANAAAMLTVE